MTRQRENFLVLMDNLEQVDELNQKVAESAGNAKEKFETVYAGSIDAKINDVKQSLQELYRALISSDAIKSFATSLNSVIRGVTSLTQLSTPLKVAMGGLAVVFALLAFNFKAIILELATAPTKFTALNIASLMLTGTTTGLAGAVTTLGVALKSLLLNPVTWGIMAVVGALALATSAISKHAKAQEEFKNKVDENKTSVDALTESLKNLDAEGIEGNSKPLIEKQDALQIELENKKRLLAEIEALKSNGVQSVSSGNNYLTGNGSQGTGSNYTSGASNMSEDTKKLQELESQLNNTTKTISSMNKEFKESGIIVDELTGKFEILTEAEEKMAIPNATKKYEETKRVLYEIEEQLAKVNELQEITPDLASELLSKYPEMEGHLGNIADAQEFLNNKHKEEVEIQNENFGIMMGNNEEFYNSKLLSDENWLEAVRKSLIAMGVSEDEAYAYDLSQFTTLNQLKDGVMNQFGGGVATWLNGYISTTNEGYNMDFRNFKSVAEAKAGVLRALNEEVKKVTANLAGATLQKNLASGLGNPFNKDKGGFSAVYDNSIKQYQDELARINGAIQEVDTMFGGFNPRLEGISSGGISTGGALGGGGSYVPSGKGDSDKGSKDKEKKEKEVADIEKLSDRYQKLNSALKLVENSLRDINTQKENANDEEKIKLIEREISWLKEKKSVQEALLVEQQQERKELKWRMGSSINIDDDLKITNAKERLDEMTNYANSLSGEAKEIAIENAKNMAEMIKRYNALHDDEIPKTLNDIKNVKNEQISAQKEIADVIKSGIEKEKDLKLKLINEEKDARIKAINEAKDKQLKALSEIKNKYNKENELDDFNENMSKEQSALAELNASRMNALKDNSALGKAMLKDIDNQIKAKKEEIAKLQLDQSRKEENEKLDKESDKISENSDSKIKEIEDGTTDAIKKLESTAESMLKQLDVDAGILGSSLDKNLVEKFKNSNAEIDSMLSKFKAMGLTDLSNLSNVSMVSEQGRNTINNQRGIGMDTAGLGRTVNNLVTNSNQSPITFSMPITVNGKPTDAEYREIENKFSDMLNKGIKALEDKMYQRELKYGLA